MGTAGLTGGRTTTGFAGDSRWIGGTYGTYRRSRMTGLTGMTPVRLEVVRKGDISVFPLVPPKAAGGGVVGHSVQPGAVIAPLWLLLLYAR